MLKARWALTSSKTKKPKRHGFSCRLPSALCVLRAAPGPVAAPQSRVTRCGFVSLYAFSIGSSCTYS